MLYSLSWGLSRRRFLASLLVPRGAFPLCESRIQGLPQVREGTSALARLREYIHYVPLHIKDALKRSEYSYFRHLFDKWLYLSIALIIRGRVLFKGRQYGITQKRCTLIFSKVKSW